MGALTGCVASLLAQGDSLSGSSSFILPFTAGGFIYIATVSVIPDILAGAHHTLKQSVMEIIALLAGVGMMVGARILAIFILLGTPARLAHLCSSLRLPRGPEFGRTLNFIFQLF